MEAGCGRVDITPTEPLDISGFVERENPSEGVLDGIDVRAFFLRNERAFVVVTCDVLYLPLPLARRLREAITGECGIPPESVWVVATHTHSAPAAGFHRLSGRVSENFVERLLHAAVEAARQAQKSAQPVERSLVAAPPCHVASNRRLPTPEGVRRTPNPEGPYDPQILWLRFLGGSGTGAHILIYGCHPVTLGPENRKISADFVGPLRRMIEEKFGGMCLFLPGALGDVDPVPAYRADPEARDDFAARVFESISESEWLTEEVEVDGPILFEKTVSLPLMELGEEDLERWLQRAAYFESTGRQKKAAALRDWANDFHMLLSSGSLPERLPLVVSLAGFGQIRLLGASAELFSTYGLTLRSQSPAPYTAVVSLCNGSFGYLPDYEAFGLGGYEVEEAPLLYGLLPLAPDAAEVAEQTFLQMLLEMGD